MPTSDESRKEALKSLDKRLEAFEAGRKPRGGFFAPRDMGRGYRFLSEVVGGVFLGAGLGWLVDYFARTEPLGLIGGLLIGAAASIALAVRGAMQWAKNEADKAGRQPSVTDDEED